MAGKSERFIHDSSGSTLAKPQTVVHVPAVTARGCPLGAVTDDGVFLRRRRKGRKGFDSSFGIRGALGLPVSRSIT